MRIYIKNLNGEKVVDVTGDVSVDINYDQDFKLGDVIVFETDTPYVTITLDEHIVKSNVFIPKGRLEYAIPFGEKLKAYHPEAFVGNKHDIKMSVTASEVLNTRRNIALNGIDKRDVVTCFPHTDANVMTRDESVFESRNAIDGYCDNKGHGQFPYHSWGGGLRDDLVFEIDFGRVVEIDQISIILRADYDGDHDINWHTGNISFSDGSEMPISMIKTTDVQDYTFEPRRIQWIRFNQLKREVSSAYSALSQLEVYGKDLVNI